MSRVRRMSRRRVRRRRRGVAGLAAAATLRRAGREVVVLEAGARAGGAAFSERIDEPPRRARSEHVPRSAGMAEFAQEHGLVRAAREGAARESRALPGARRPPGSGADGPARVRAHAAAHAAAASCACSPSRSCAAAIASGESVAEFASGASAARRATGLIGAVPHRRLRGRRESARRRGGVPRAGRSGTAQRFGRARDPRARAARRVPEPLRRDLVRDGRHRGDHRRRSPLRSAQRCGWARRRFDRIRGRRASHRRRSAKRRGDPREGARRGDARARCVAAARGSGREVARRSPRSTTRPSRASRSRSRDDATRVPVRGFGYLVPRGEGDALLRLSLPEPALSRVARRRDASCSRCSRAASANPRRSRGPTTSSSPRSARELDRVLGLREAPRVLAITRWPRAVPQPGRDHPRLVAGLRRAARARPAPRARRRASRRRRLRRRARIRRARRQTRDGGTMSNPDCIFCKIVAGEPRR